MTLPWESVLLLVAAGVHAMAATVLLLLDPPGRSVRWFVAFLVLLASWFVVRGAGLAAAPPSDAAALLLALLPRALPPLFLAFALTEASDLRARWLLLVVAAAAAAQSVASGSWVAEGVRLACWVGSGVLLWRARPSWAARQGRALYVTLALFSPVLAVVLLLGGGRATSVVLPLATVGIVVLVFVGIVRYRLYEIEVRVARSGALAAAGVEQDRLAVLGELAASVAHEVRNPLTGVRSLAQRLAEEQVDEARRRRYAGVIVQEVGRVEALVERLLALARRRPAGEAPADVATPLAPLLEDVALLVGSRAERAGVSLAVQGGDAVVAAPREALAQVLLNLLLNAVAHTPRGGRVTCDARSDGAHVLLVVRDEGPGVPAADRARIFEPFETGGGGTGLGLAVTRRLVDEMGGTVRVGDAPGGGAEFVVRLPEGRLSALGPRLSAEARAVAERRAPRAESGAA